MSDEPKMQDSGERRTFSTGAVRDRGDFKPRPDLISPHANLREGAWLALGAKKYAIDNWTKGMPIRDCMASIARHLEAYKLGLVDEDHMAAIRTNAGFILHFEEEIKAGRLPAELDDMPKYAGVETMYFRGVPITYTPHLDPGTVLMDTGEGLVTIDNVSADVSDETVVHPQWPKHISSGHQVPELAKPFTVYLCGPISGDPVDQQWRDCATAYLSQHGIQTLDPLRGKKTESISNQGMSYDGELASTEMAGRDKLDIEEADLIFAHFPYCPERQSIGSLMEMGAAAIGLDKPVVLCTDIPVFKDHLFCRRFCVNEPDFEIALKKIVELAKEDN